MQIRSSCVYRVVCENTELSSPRPRQLVYLYIHLHIYTHRVRDFFDSFRERGHCVLYTQRESCVLEHSACYISCTARLDILEARETEKSTREQRSYL